MPEPALSKAEGVVGFAFALRAGFDKVATLPTLIYNFAVLFQTIEEP
jgi:hypothetical protein